MALLLAFELVEQIIQLLVAEFLQLGDGLGLFFLLLPQTPMLFQGQEFFATAPFLYFVDHKPELVAPVQLLTVRDEPGNHFTLGEPHRTALNAFDVILLRQDPPFRSIVLCRGWDRSWRTRPFGKPP